MGTDIHVFVEETTASESYCLAEFQISRNYELFNALGDGRNSQMYPEDVEKLALYPPRGMPGDLSEHVRLCYYESVTDTPSWLALDEIYKALKHHDLDLLSKSPNGSHWQFCGLLDFMELAAKEIGKGNLRLVFWFDS